MSIIIMTVKTGHTNAYRILSPGNMSFVLRIILEAEQKSREHLFIVIRKLVRPDFLCSITCRCRHAATFHKFDSRFYRDSKCPSCPIFRYIWLVYPCTGDIYAVWKVRFYTFPQRCCRPGLQSGIRHSFKFYILDAFFPTEISFELRAAIRVDNENIRLYSIKRVKKIKHATT